MQLRLPARRLAPQNSGLFVVALGLLCAQLSTAAEEPAAKFSAAQVEFFETEIRPLLVDRCWKCHGENKQQGGLRLDSREAILQGGDLGSAAEPGDPAASRLVEVITYAGDLKMPPSGKLDDRQTAAVIRWVREGLAWPETNEASTNVTGKSATKPSERPIPWSFHPVVDPLPPQVAQAEWCRSPIDHFVLSRLEQAELQPAPAADKQTLIRRVKFDLLGLPPTPEEIDAFLADESPEAFARLVDRYLAAPEYGQRWARHWLDVARYADSNGQDENLAYVNAYRYRDYVVDAFNADKPYDQFVREQIAGDLSPVASDTSDDPKLAEQRQYQRLIATGFLTLGPKMLAEDDPVKMEMDIVDEQLDTLGGAFLGLTLGCARCHDHKFDPISTADYYGLAGIFKSTRTMDNFKVVAQWHERPLANAAEIAVVAEHRQKVDTNKSELNKLQEQANAALLATARQRLADYLIAASDVLAAPGIVSLLQDPQVAVSASAPAGTIVREAEQFDRGNVLVNNDSYGVGVIINRGELPNFAEYDLEISQAGWYQLELRFAAAESRPVQILIDGKVRRSAAAAAVTGSWTAETQRWSPEGLFELPAGKIVIRIERAAGPIPHFDLLALAPRNLDPASMDALPQTPDEVAHARGLVAPFLLQWIEHLRQAQGAPESIWQLWFALRQGNFANAEQEAAQLRGVAARTAQQLLAGGDVENSAQLAARYQMLIEAAAAPPVGDHQSVGSADDAVESALRAVVATGQGPFRLIANPEQHYSTTERDAVAILTKSIKELEAAAPAPLPQAMAVEEGKPSDLPIHIRGSHLSLGEVVPRRFPKALAPDSTPLSSDASGRLELARWITEPAHPLTARVMVNRLWRWHFGAGLVRSTDNFGNLGEAPSHPELLDWLATRLVESGWSLKAMHRLIVLSSTYQSSTAYNAIAAEADPDNRLLWRMNRRRLEAEAMRDALLFVSGRLDTSLGGTLLHNKPREYVTSTASINATNYNLGRRSIYLPVVRSALYDVFQAFDFAEPTTLQGNRDSTTIASQALFMMNSNLMHEQSEALAERLLAERPEGWETRVERLYRLVFGRRPTDRESERAGAFLGSAMSRETFTRLPLREQHAWQSLCRVLLSTNEFLYVE